MVGVHWIAKIDRQDRSAIDVLRLIETEMCPRQNVVAQGISVVTVWLDNDFLNHRWTSSWAICVAPRQCEPDNRGLSGLPRVLWSAPVLNDSVAGTSEPMSH
jgi:hypothetical protein